MSYIFHMTEHLLRRQRYLMAFRDGLNTAEIARMHKVPEYMVHNEITMRAGSIEQAIADVKRELGRT